jgi:hypothetical protein
LKIRKVINHGNIRYSVTANLDGDRTQRFFPSKREAQFGSLDQNEPFLAAYKGFPGLLTCRLHFILVI